MATGTEVLNAGRGDHVVLFYRDGQELAERVSRTFFLPSKTVAWRSWSPRQITAEPSTDTWPAPASMWPQPAHAATT